MTLVPLILVLATISNIALSNSLLAAKTGGNPSFEIGVSFSEVPDQSQMGRLCQATLIRRQKLGTNWACTLVTASHCLSDGNVTSKATYLFTADFGVIARPVILSRSPILKGMTDDTSMVFFNNNGCERVAQEMVVPLGEVPTSGTDRMGLPREIFMASRTFATIFTTRLPSDYRTGLPLIRLSLGTADVNGVQQTMGIYGGDSGGGLFLKNTSGEYELVGVASVGEYFVAPSNPGREPGSREGSPMPVFVSDLEWVRQNLAK